jgi:hypothetical protein
VPIMSNSLAFLSIQARVCFCAATVPALRATVSTPQQNQVDRQCSLGNLASVGNNTYDTALWCQQSTCTSGGLQWGNIKAPCLHGTMRQFPNNSRF